MTQEVTPSTTPLERPEEVKESVKEYYGEVLKTSADLKTSACCTAVAPPRVILDVLRAVPDEIKEKYYGCGSPFPLGIKGLRVLDLGCGSGRDCYVCSAIVGPEGQVTGVDMTPAQLEVARRHVDSWTKHLGYAKPNLRFVQGEIEELQAAGVDSDSTDIVISNCVVNLSPNKGAVLREVYRVLAPGGEMYFSDVYCDRRLPEEARTHPVLVGECLGGALSVDDFSALCKEVGFADPRQLSSNTIDVHDPELSALLGDAKFFSITYRLFKLPGALDAASMDYGQAASYKGTLPGHASEYQLDSTYNFVKGQFVPVCGNTAAMLTGSWLGPHFTVLGDKSVCNGEFNAKEKLACMPKPGAQRASGCCGPKSCC